MLHIVTQTFNHRNSYGYAHSFTVFYLTDRRNYVLVVDDCSSTNAAMVCYKLFGDHEHSLHLESSTRLTRESKQERRIYNPIFRSNKYIIDYLRAYGTLCEPIHHIPSQPG